MQNNNTGTLAIKVPVVVVPNPARCPSWNTHTSAPNDAVSDSKLRMSALTGSTTLPVSTNSSTNVIAAITVSTVGKRLVIAAALSRFICAVPVKFTCRPAGPAVACRRSSWVSDAAENNGAVLLTVTKELPYDIAVGADGGPARVPAAKVPPGADTDATSGTRDRAAA